MPILRKNGSKIYFVHTPKTAGSSLYLWVMENGWQISNLGTPKGPLNFTGVGKKIRENYGIFHLQQEGDYSQVKTSPQHVTADIWTTWGPFDKSFAIVREPIERFQSALTFQYTSALRQQNRQHSTGLLESFRDAVLTRLEEREEAASALFDNHFCPQKSFVTVETQFFFFHGNWKTGIADFLGLRGAIGHEKKAPMKIELNARELAFAQAHYAEDIEWFTSLQSA